MIKNDIGFELERRDPLLKYNVYHEQSEYFKEDKSHRYNKVQDSNNSITMRSRISWSLTLGKMEYAILEYSSGNSIDKVKNFFCDALNELNKHKNHFEFKVFDYWEADSFQFLLWALSLSVLTGNRSVIETTISRMIAKNPQGDDDPILSILLARLGFIGFPRQELLAFPKSYQHLYNTIKGDRISPTKEERQESLKLYLKGWYKGMKDCYWYNRHKGKFPTYFGYWAFEAGMVTLLYGLDDSSYRHMLYYPKDLVDYAREHQVEKLFPSPPEMVNYIVFPNDECPISGEFICNLSSQKITLDAGQRVPGPIENEHGQRLFWVSQS